MDSTWINDADQLAQFCRGMDGGPLAVDTESDHFHAYQARVCLIQVADGEREALVDPLALGETELSPLFERLADPGIVTILHSARNDILEIDRDFGVGVRGLFDTQIAARFLNTEGNGLTWMLEELVGIETGKAFKRFDWTTRPIPDDARRYALDDVRYLDELRNQFLDGLDEEGWLEPFRQQCEFIARSVSYESDEFNPGDWRGIKGTDSLDGRGRATLKELFRWRHELCQDKNQSAVTLFPNRALLNLAKIRPTRQAGVMEVPGMPDDLAEQHGQAIADVVSDSLTVEEPPKNAPSESYDPPPQAQQDRYHAIRRWRNETAERLGIPAEFIATNDTISEIAASPPGTRDELNEFSAVLPWHVDRFGEEIMTILRRS